MSSLSLNEVEIRNEADLKVSRTLPNEYAPGYSAYQKGPKYQEPANEQCGGYVNSVEQIYEKPMGQQKDIGDAVEGNSNSLQVPKTCLIVTAIVMMFLLVLAIVQFAMVGILSKRLSDVESKDKELRSLLTDGGQSYNDILDSADGDNSGGSSINALEQRILQNMTQRFDGQIDSILESVSDLESDVQDVASRLDNLQNNTSFGSPIDGKTASDLLMDAGVHNASKYVTEYGYIAIQERSSSSLSFYRALADYKNGFNDSANFWIGLDVIHKLTSKYTWILRIEALVLGSGFLAVGEYYNFRVASAEENFRLNIDYEISSMFGSNLLLMNARPFEALVSTSTSYPCSGYYRFRGGWWYPSGCGYINLNAPFDAQSHSSDSYRAKVSANTMVYATKMLIKRA